MRVLWVLLTLSPLTAFAGQRCDTPDGSTRLDLVKNRNGIALIIQGAPDLKRFYKERFGFEISTMETVKDPETKRYLTEKTRNGFRFMLYAPDTSWQNVWGSEFTFNSGDINQPESSANVGVIDQEGNSFTFGPVKCLRTPDLE